MPGTSHQIPKPSADHLPTVSYRDLVQEKFGRVWDKFEAVDRATTKAEADLASYKILANEFRGSLSDQRTLFVTKEDLLSVKETMEIQRLRIDKIDNLAANMQGRLWMLAAIFAILQVIINIAQRFLSHIP